VKEGVLLMANTKITITFDTEKLSALRQFSEKDAPPVDAFLQEQLEKLYVKIVPAPVRQYIEGKATPVPERKHPAKPKPPSAEM